MAASVILIEATPRDPATGAAVTVRLAGGGASVPYLYGGEHWRAGIASLPNSVASLDFDGEQLGGGGVAQALEVRWSPASNAALAELASLFWTDAPVTVRIGAEGEAMPPVATTGLVLETASDGGALRIVLADKTTDLKRPLLVDRYAGTGGIEGPVEFEGAIKTRAWGRCFNVPGREIDRANNIWCFGDPRRATCAPTSGARPLAAMSKPRRRSQRGSWPRDRRWGLRPARSPRRRQQGPPRSAGASTATAPPRRPRSANCSAACRCHGRSSTMRSRFGHGTGPPRRASSAARG
jgi:hypothetical protein